MLYIVLLSVRAPSYVLLVLVGMCSVFWLFWLSYQYLPSDWLERLLRGSLTVARGSSPDTQGRRVFMIFFLLYCIVSLFYDMSQSVVPRPYVIYSPTPMARYSLFVLKVSFNKPNQPTLANIKVAVLVVY